MTKNKIINRILTQYHISGYEALLNEMPLTDLQSLLIEIYNQRVKQITPQELLFQYQKNRFVQPSKLNPKDILAFELLAYDLLPDHFKLLQLSPVCPLGTVSTIAPISQNMILTTIRNTEVCSDVTNVLALESALQRKKLLHQKESKLQTIKLCASHRLLRTQPCENSSYIPHFQIFSLCIAGRDEGSYQFEISALKILIPYFYQLINDYVYNKTTEKPTIKVKLFTANEILNQQLIGLSKTLSKSDNLTISSQMNPDENWNYYHHLRFHIYLQDKNTQKDFFICDGGDTTWTASLLSDKKERFMISGLGSELLIGKFLSN